MLKENDPMEKQDQPSFYRNLWFWLFVALVVVIGASGASYVKGKSNVVQTGQPKVVAEADTPSIADPKPDNLKVENTPTATSNPKHEFLEKKIAEGKVIRAQSGKEYKFGQWVLFPYNDVGIKVDDFSFSYSYGDTVSAKYVYVVNFEISNDSLAEYAWSYRDFKLMDGYGYTYSVSLTARTKGDLYGTVPVDKSRSGQIGFDVTGDINKPITSINTLIYTPPGSSEGIRFTLDSQELRDKGSQGGQ